GDIAATEPGVATLTPIGKLEGPAPDDAAAREKDVLARTGIETSDMYVAFVPEGSSEWKAGLRAGDRITSLDGAPARMWTTFEARLKTGASKMHALEWTRAGEPMAGTFQVRKEQWGDEVGQHYERYVFRTTHWLPNAPDSSVENPHLWLYALRGGVEQTGRVIKFISVSLVRLVQGKVSLASVSGPITIYDVAGQAGARG